VRIHSVAPLATYVLSVTITMRSQPSPHQLRNFSAPMTARSSAWLLVCG
jgi:hypothetical protein